MALISHLIFLRIIIVNGQRELMLDNTTMFSSLATKTTMIVTNWHLSLSMMSGKK